MAMRKLWRIAPFLLHDSSKWLWRINKKKAGRTLSHLTDNKPQLIHVHYADPVLYNRASALAMQPQIREAIGWLIYECDNYITLCWDKDAGPPTLHGGDPKALVWSC